MDTAAAECERQADGQREETEGEKRGEKERREERGRHENMRGSKGAREQSRTCEKCSSVLFFNALLWRWCMKLECHKMLNMVIISRSHTLTHTLDVWTHSKSASTRPNNEKNKKTLTTTPPHLTDETIKTFKFSPSNLPNSDVILCLNFVCVFFSDCCFVVVYFCGPLRIKQGIKYDSSSVLQLETCESLWECGGV